MVDLTFNQEKSDKKTFEINLVVRDSDGEPTGKTKSFATDDSSRLWEFWSRHQGKPKKRKRNNSQSKKKKTPSMNLPTGKQAEKILSDLYKNTED